MLFNVFEGFKFSLKVIKGEGLNLLQHKKMLQRLPFALAQIKVDSTSEF